MLVKGGQGKTIILYKGFVNKFYAANSCINSDLSVDLLTILPKIIVNSYAMIPRIRVYNI